MLFLKIFYKLFLTYAKIYINLELISKSDIKLENIYKSSKNKNIVIIIANIC